MGVTPCRKCHRLLVGENFDPAEGAYKCPDDGYYSGYSKPREQKRLE